MGMGALCEATTRPIIRGACEFEAVPYNGDVMKTSELDYYLPEELIAQQALSVRESSRLLVLNRADGSLAHRRFSDVADYLQAGDCLVLNESKVIPARFYCQRVTGGRIEGLFLKLDEAGHWQVLLKNAGKVKTGERLVLLCPNTMTPGADAVQLKAEVRLDNGGWVLSPEPARDHLSLLEAFGVTPLPPYIQRQAGQADAYDQQRYQTVYAKTPGSVAAPTAGLHFSQGLLKELGQKGITLAKVTLHVGQDTFKPVTAEELEEHPIHTEYCALDAANAAIINDAAARGGRVIAVGTTSVRTLESAASNGTVRAYQGATKLFITPGYRFKIVGGMITNFHLPRTTLLALVCAFAGKEFVLNAYREAVAQRYRFFSYGDAMLIL